MRHQTVDPAFNMDSSTKDKFSEQDPNHLIAYKYPLINTMGTPQGKGYYSVILACKWDQI